MQILTNFKDEKAVVPENDEILFIDNSIISTFRSCEEKARLAFVLDLKSKHLALPLAFGSAMHKAIEFYHNSISEGMSQTVAMQIGINAMLKNLEDDKSQMPRSISNIDGEKRSVERCKMLFCAYVQKWSEDLFRTKHVEVGFAIDLGIYYKNKPILAVGKIDRIVERIITRTIHNIETKTTGTGLSYFMEQKRPNHQVTGYHVAARELLGINPESTIWDAIFISTRQPDMKKGGWFEYGIDIDKDFDRQETRRSEEDINQWYFDIRRTALQFFENKYSNSPRWARNTSMCHSYGGCGFKIICESNLNPAVIQSEYVKKRWEPWNITNDDKIQKTTS